MRSLFVALALSCFSLACRADLLRYAPVDAMHAEVAQRVAAGQFEQLLRDADRYQKSQERFLDGRWKLAVLYGGFKGCMKTASEADWVRDTAAAVALTKRHPTSSNAWLLLAALYDSHAWAARGCGYANTVGDDDFARFHALLQQAIDVLDQHKAALAGNPHWYALRIAVGGSVGEDRAQLDTLFAEALRASPNYQQTWFTRLHFLTPKWGGSVDEMVGLINLAARHPSVTDGGGLVAHLLRFAADDGYPDLVRDSRIDWSVVRQSYDDVLDRYPAAFNARHFVLEACGRSDKAETAHLLGRVKEAAPAADLGDDAWVYDRCGEWASGKIPKFAMRDRDTGRVTIIK